MKPGLQVTNAQPIDALSSLCMMLCIHLQQNKQQMESVWKHPLCSAYLLTMCCTCCAVTGYDIISSTASTECTEEDHPHFFHSRMLFMVILSLHILSFELCLNRTYFLLLKLLLDSNVTELLCPCFLE